MKFTALGLILGLGLVSAVGCGSDDSDGGNGGSGGGSAANFCEDICTKVDSVGCSKEIKADCLKDCASQYSTCKTQFEAIAACVQTTATLSCDADGDLVIKGCDSSLTPFAECIACLPAQGDTACDTCVKAKCCAENKALLAASGVLTLISCLETCAPNDSACAQTCASNNPEAGAALSTAIQCQTDKCSAECNP